MKRLILVRHGKSSWKQDLPDHERPLKKRGYRDGNKVSKTFKEFYSPPVKVWSSPAVRALETAKMFKDTLEISDENFLVRQDLYTFDAKELMEIIKSCPDTVDKLMVFGHNPAMTNTVNTLGDKNLENLPTTGLCVIDFENHEWKNIKDGKTIITLIPKNLR
ncbi:histidine phosphatase family protein [Salegentibacter sp. F188]|uniref:Histidine phosphatase family protein n=1 Tax=Autumnicola patrickiae TaxID=3075591 RepID=A0ABU3E3V3_9FLAO|nr:histidine phosphatase family protein [Salegentibacter sp. F188]MDT0690678.1 histidine phosphatase family protein [Salegentibacter sp. F188]